MRFVAWIVLGGLLALSSHAEQQSPALARQVHADLAKAEKALDQGRHKAALKLLDGLLEQVKDKAFETSVVLQTRAFVYIAQRRYADAAKDLRQALNSYLLPPTVSHPLRFSLAQLYAQLERNRDAARELQIWMKNEPTPDRDALLFAAQVNGTLKHWKTAIGYARRALKQSAKPVERDYRLLLSLYLQAKHYKSATTLLEKEMLVHFPDKLGYWKQLAGLHMQRGQSARAAAALALAHKRGLLKASDLRRLAGLYLHQNVPKKAAELLEEEMKKGRLTSAKDYRLLADACQLAREPEQALKALEKAGAAADFQKAGELLLDMDRWSEAGDKFRAALAHEALKNADRTRLLLGIALMRQEKNDAARHAFQLAQLNARSPAIRDQAGKWLAFLDVDAPAPMRNVNEP